MNEVIIELSDKWYSEENVSVCGAAYLGGKLKRADNLCDCLNKVNTQKEMLNTIQNFNGFFSAILKKNNHIYAAVDRIRSIPLFYSKHNNILLLSDNAYKITSNLGVTQLDPVSEAEFVMTGYVTGSRTLDPRVFQLQPGELLVFNTNKNDIQVCRYYIHKHQVNLPMSEDTLINLLDKAVLASIKNLIHYADGRTIVIPLSGGLDSRLIAISLKRLGYNNIIAFSYGRKENRESRISESVAKQLEIQWHFVEYTEEKWKSWFNSREFGNYMLFAGQMSSLAHIQDWPAIMELTHAGIIPEDAVIVPGHTGDFLAGSHIPLELMFNKRCDHEDAVRAVWNHHYVLTTPKLIADYINVNADEISKSLLGRIRSHLKDEKVKNLEDAIDAFERWDWGERQAKFIVNSVRVYDFWEYDWWLPWWDYEFIKFWEQVPLKYRINRCLYRKYVAGIQHQMNINMKEVSTKMTLKDFMVKVNMLSLAYKVHDVINKLKYFLDFERSNLSHPMAWYGITENLKQYQKFSYYKSNINTYLAYYQINIFKKILEGSK